MLLTYHFSKKKKPNNFSGNVGTTNFLVMIKESVYIMSYDYLKSNKLCLLILEVNKLSFFSPMIYTEIQLLHLVYKFYLWVVFVALIKKK